MASTPSKRVISESRAIASINDTPVFNREKSIETIESQSPTRIKKSYTHLKHRLSKLASKKPSKLDLLDNGALTTFPPILHQENDVPIVLVENYIRARRRSGLRKSISVMDLKARKPSLEHLLERIREIPDLQDFFMNRACKQSGSTLQGDLCPQSSQETYQEIKSCVVCDVPFHEVSSLLEDDLPDLVCENCLEPYERLHNIVTAASAPDAFTKIIADLRRIQQIDEQKRWEKDDRFL